MNLLELKDKIKSHLVAGYPGLYIHSGEEARVDTMLQDVAAQLNLHPKEWNLGYGWVDFFNKQPRGSQGAKTELADSLPALLDDDLDGKLFIIKDARSALENQPLAVARLKQLLNRIQRHHRGKAAVVLVSETLHIPPPIEAQITLLPLPLPRGEEIASQLDNVCQHLELLVPENLRQRLHAACSGLSQEEIRSALAMVRLQHEQINDAALALIQHEKEQIIAKSGVLEMLRVSENATDIGGLENLKLWLGRRAQIFRRLGEAHDARVQAPKGVLIAGMPGCGKSLTAKAAAGLFQLPLLRLDIGSLLGKYVGESEHNMRRALTMAESVSPCILWIDELEKAFVGMTSGSGSEVSSRLFGYFLTWMQEKTGAVFVIATANNITALPPELLRKGRFDEVFYVGFPNAAERGAILDIHLKGEELELSAEERSTLITQCRDYAGADIQNAINEAREAAFLDSRALKFEDVEAAIELTVPLRETLREQVAKYEELFEKLKLKPASACDGLSVAQMIQMADSVNALRREEVARSEDCPDDLLEKLAGDQVEDIRIAVYSNPNCPERVLTLRINIEDDHADFDLDLLHLACVHPQAPQDLLASEFHRLELKPEHRRLLATKSSHEPLLREMLQDKDPEVRRALAQNRHIGNDTQRQLSKDTEDSVRLALAGNPVLSSEVQSLLSRDAHADVRETLARLPSLSETVQLNLARDEETEVHLALATRGGEAALPDSVQLQLAQDGADVRLQLAGNPAIGAPAQLLLAQDTHIEVRKALARHPALASATLQYLAKDSESVQIELAGNRSLNSALLQRGLVQSESADVRAALAGNDHASIEILGLLSRDPDESVREKLVSNDAINAQIIDTLLQDPHTEVREAMLIWCTELSAEQQQRIAKDPEPSVREQFAWHCELNEDSQVKLLGDTVQVRENLARNYRIGTSIQQQLAVDGEVDVRRALARNLSLGGPVQARLAEDPEVAVRVDLAGNLELTAPVFTGLLKDVMAVQIELAGHTSLTQGQYAQLARSEFDEVRQTLAGNTNLGEDVMRELAQATPAPALHAAWYVIPEPSKVDLALAGNAKLPVSLQSDFHNNWVKSTPLMEVLAGNPALDSALQGKLATHSEYSVRAKLAANPKLALDVAQKLAKDSTATVRSALIGSQPLPADIEERLCGDSSHNVRVALAANPHLSNRTQHTLATDNYEEVRTELLKRASGHPGFALKLMAQCLLTQDSEFEIRALLAEHPHLSLALQSHLAEDDSITVRKALAGTPSNRWGRALSEEVQLRLLKDRESSVRVALAGNAQLLPHVQLALARDTDIKVRKALIDKSSSYGPRLLIVAQKTLANDASEEVRIALASTLFGGHAPPSNEEILLTLAGDSSLEVKEAIAFSLSFGDAPFSEAVMTRLMEGLDEETRASLEDILASCDED